MKKIILYTIIALSVNIVNAQWQQTSLSTGKISSIVIDGNNIFAGDTSGVFLSNDNGDSWTAKNNGFPSYTYINILAINGSNIFAGTNNGMYLSSNNGDSWTEMNNGLPTVDHSIETISFIGNKIFVGTYNNGLYISNSNGNNWTISNSGLTSPWISAIAYNDTNIFVGAGLSMFLSTDSGGSWTTINNGLGSHIIRKIAVNNGNVFAGTTDGVYKTTNNGSNWNLVNNGLLNTSIFDFSFVGSNTFMSTLGGVYLSIDYGSSWTEQNAGLLNSYVWSIAASNTNLFAGTFMGGVWRRPISEMVSITENANKENIKVYPNPTNDKIIIDNLNIIHSVNISNTLGESIYFKNNFEKNNSIEIDFSNVPKGIYFVKVDNGEQVHIEKVVLN